ncbi:hypothetical protein AB0M45_21950 [Nocardia sp. NPDC051787]|uniref:hypothetical protein n=1 Tax=Nocardia sp. NPDC051787 TaxID=3155415 RepID=UPI00342EEA89
MKPDVPTAPPDRRRIRHIRIESGALRLDYQACAEQAESVADHLARRFPELTVTVDDELHDGLPPLPCAQTLGLISQSHLRKANGHTTNDA